MNNFVRTPENSIYVYALPRNPLEPIQVLERRGGRNKYGYTGLEYRWYGIYTIYWIDDDGNICVGQDLNHINIVYNFGKLELAK